jgi:hypothetical protein
MVHKLSFGKHEGKTCEWIFFKAPWYAQWIYENRIYRQEHNFDEQEGDNFREMYRRASHLGGVCCQCDERPVTRMGLTTHFRSGDLGAVGFYCEECEYQGGDRTGYYHPSFFVDAYTLEPGEQAMILNEIIRHYVGIGNLTQKRMEGFFHNDANFGDATAGFFGNNPKRCIPTSIVS